MCAGGEGLLILKAHLMGVRVWPPTNQKIFMLIVVQNGKSVWFAQAKDQIGMHSYIIINTELFVMQV